MSDVGKDTDRSPVPGAGAPPSDKGRRRPTAGSVSARAHAVRHRLASVVWLVAVLCALVLAMGALVVALRMNQENNLVRFILDTAEVLDFGELKTFEGGKDAETRSALVNWGVPAVVYLVMGKILDHTIRP